MVIIYALLHPVTNEVRYVGKTGKTLHKRLQSHCNAKLNARSSKWIRSLKKQGLLPVAVELEMVGDDKWVDSEMFWISYLNSLGADLVNHTKGGEGTLGLRLSKKSKQLISIANRGKTLTKETRAKIALKKLGNKCALGFAKREETKKAMSLRFKGQKLSDERKLQMSLDRKGKNWSDSRKQNHIMKKENLKQTVLPLLKEWLLGETIKALGKRENISPSTISAIFREETNYADLKKIHIKNRVQKEEYVLMHKNKKKVQKTKTKTYFCECGKEFDAWVCYEKRGGNKYCSHKCYTFYKKGHK